jgi:squalene-associated FAD-dependent desaturase
MAVAVDGGRASPWYPSQPIAVARALIIGGGLSGLAAASALGRSGIEVELLEARGFLGGRATSYPLPSPGGETAGQPQPHIDNCQHILLRCCVNLLDFYAHLGVADHIRFFGKFYFLEPGGRVSELSAGRLLPAPLHFTMSFALRMKCLSLADKASLARGLLALRREQRNGRPGLDRISMAEWLREKGQTPRTVERFWRPVLVSAINEELDRMAAAHGFQVFWLGFLARKDASEMGVPAVPLGELYSAGAWSRWPEVQIRLRQPVERVLIEDGRAAGVLTTSGERRDADFVVLALPFERVATVLPELGRDLDLNAFEHSPITGIHLWFDRPVTTLPHGTLLDRTVQWFFNKDAGRYLQIVVSASRSLVAMDRQQVIDLAVRELAEFLPAVAQARLEKAHVVKEVRATFSARPGLGALRPGTATRWPNLFLAGDWTRSGWPATMEGAVRSGYIAAEAVTRAAGRPARFLLPDIA